MPARRRKRTRAEQKQRKSRYRVPPDPLFSGLLAEAKALDELNITSAEDVPEETRNRINGIFSRMSPAMAGSDRV
jgi:hypothetical protein